MPISVAFLIAALVQSSAPDAFVAQHDLAAARNPASAAFTIAFEGDRRTFRIGEQIPIVLIYDYVRDRGSLKGVPLRHFATPVLDHTDGAADPIADIERALISIPGGVCGCVEGAVVGPAPKPPAVRLNAKLTDSVRFHQPGHYRIYIPDHHDNEYHPLNDPPPPIVSNILEFDITRDRAWEDSTLDEAVRVLDTSQDPDARAAATDAIGMIDSPRAVDELVKRRLIPSLFTVHDRQRAIRGLSAVLEDPEYAASFDDIRELAILQLTSAIPGALSPSQKRAAMRAVEVRRLATLRRAGTLVQKLVHSFRNELETVGADPIFGRRPGKDGEEMERRLIVALEFGRSWRLTEEDAAAIRAGCVDPDGCSIQLPALSDEAKVWIELDAATHRLVYYVGTTRVPTEGQFVARLSLLPSGTVLRWGPASFEKLLGAWDRDLDRYLPVAALLAARQGMRIVN